MATYSWPTGQIPTRCILSSMAAGESFRSPYNGTAQFVDFVAERWMLSVTFPPAPVEETGAIEGFFLRMTGGRHRVNAWHFARPVPNGTLRGTLSLASSAARGDTSLRITGSSGTLKAGDMLGCGGQLFMVAEDVTVSGSTYVQMVHRVRGTIASGSSVTWDYPTGQFVMPSYTAGVTYSPAFSEGASFDFEEVW